MTEEFIPQGADDEVRVDDGSTAQTGSEATSPRGAQTAPRYADGPVAVGPAVTRHEIGEGVAWYLGTHLDAESLGRMLERTTDDVDMRPVAGIRTAPAPDVGPGTGPAQPPAPGPGTEGPTTTPTPDATATGTGSPADAPAGTGSAVPLSGATPPPPGWVAPGAMAPTPAASPPPAPVAIEGERTWVAGRRSAAVPETTPGHGVQPGVRPAPAWARGGSGPVEVLRRHGPQGWYLFVLNHSGIPVEVPVSGDDLITGTRARGMLRVPAGGCAVVRELPSADG